MSSRAVHVMLLILQCLCVCACVSVPLLLRYKPCANILPGNISCSQSYLFMCQKCLQAKRGEPASMPAQPCAPKSAGETTLCPQTANKQREQCSNIRREERKCAPGTITDSVTKAERTSRRPVKASSFSWGQLAHPGPCHSYSFRHSLRVESRLSWLMGYPCYSV